MTIESKVKEIVADKLGVEEYEVQPWANFEKDLGADSLDQMELVMEFEKEFGVSILDSEVKLISTVGDALCWLYTHLPEPDSSSSVSTGIKYPNDSNGKSGLKNG